MDIFYLDLQGTDAAWNLAAEQYVFDSLSGDRNFLMLWQNKRAVILGKYQNAHTELNMNYIREHQVQVVRRLSGGGAVYHDLGNLNFTFITAADPSARVDLEKFCRPVADVLRSLGVPAELNGRNDICVDGKKCSGNAQYVRHGRVMHHGTILFDSDLDAVSQALHANAEKLNSKGVASVRSRVVNLRPYLDPSVNMEIFRSLLLQELVRGSTAEARTLTTDDMREIERIKRERYDCWDWNYGRSPAGNLTKTQRIEGCGTVTAAFSVDAGRLTEISFSGDFFSTVDPERLAQKLIGCQLQEESLAEFMECEPPAKYFTGMTKEAFLNLLL